MANPRFYTVHGAASIWKKIHVHRNMSGMTKSLLAAPSFLRTLKMNDKPTNMNASISELAWPAAEDTIHAYLFISWLA